MSKKLYFILLLLVIVSSFCNAQKVSKIEALLEEALLIKVTAKTVESGGLYSWDMETIFITLPGRPVKLTLNGKNIEISAFLTTYLEDGDIVYLIAQGEMWITDIESGEVLYFTDTKNITVKLGDKIFYFPLGYTEIENPETNIELDIQLFRYTDYLKLVSTESSRTTEHLE